MKFKYSTLSEIVKCAKAIGAVEVELNANDRGLIVTANAMSALRKTDYVCRKHSRYSAKCQQRAEAPQDPNYPDDKRPLDWCKRTTFEPVKIGEMRLSILPEEFATDVWSETLQTKDLETLLKGANDKYTWINATPEETAAA